MPRRPSTFRLADVVRAVKAARAADVAIGSLEVTPEGIIRIVARLAVEQSPANPFDTWKAKRDARPAERS